ncbi:hypothetical protein [Microtetraspora niveoalba]|uniref:hypothetical protein n=1 Tax=Microtetraspora niveoalba TaxID=46175 RepID=UPI00082A4A57|nr:hypothetical protein [Microtetraspora niveoalba]
MRQALRVAVTGHRDLTPATLDLVAAAIHEELRGRGPAVVGVSCLAPGADQIFADAVLDLGGALEVVVPARRYGRALPERDRAEFERLLARAGSVVRLPYDVPTPETYRSANEVLLDGADLLIAVWDGRPARGRGGTAEVVGEALRRDIEVRVVWPEGAARSESS